MKMMAWWKKDKKEVSLDDLLKEMWKTIDGDGKAEVLIRADPKIIQTQRRDLHVIEMALENVKNANEHDLVYINASLAVGYANAMQAHGIIDEDELKRLNAMIGVIAERRLAQVEKIDRKSFFKDILNFRKATA